MSHRLGALMMASGLTNRCAIEKRQPVIVNVNSVKGDTTGGMPRYHRGSVMAPSLRSASRKRSRAQAMTEFAIVAPILFFLLLGIFESGLLLFVVGTARWSTAEVARQ